jgi:hypothetical protein
MKKKIILAIVLCLCGNLVLQAQELEQTGSLTTGTISSQFDYLQSISNNYQDYKVVKNAHLTQLKSNVTDSIRVFQNEIRSQKEAIKSQQDDLEQLQALVETIKTELKAAEDARDSFSFMGIDIQKSAYSSILWSLIAAMALALLYFLYQYFQSHKIVLKARKDLEDTIEEFEQHRRNTLERERKLKRELVDALNRKTN